jgi:hypothetical protein
MMKNSFKQTKGHKQLLVIFLILLSYGVSYAQFVPKKIIQFSGVVMTADSLLGIPFVTVYNKHDRRGTVSKEDGFFSFAALEGDTIIFHSLGFINASYIIPIGLPDVKFTAIQLMTRDDIYLDPIIVYPYPNLEQFKKDFVTSSFPTDQVEIAYKNLERQRMRELGESMAMDGGENTDYFMRKEAQRFYYAGQVAPQNIFNPLAWAKFIKAWKNGEFKRDKASTE